MTVSAVELIQGDVFLKDGREILPASDEKALSAAGISLKTDIDRSKKGTIAHGILAAHHDSANEAAPGVQLQLRFDALASHDITYVGIIQTARVSGLKSFPVPYVLTNCHNSLCAVGGTINSDDHAFGLSAAKKYGGIYIPPHLAVIHSYMREAFAGCGKMILGSDSHTRYGALGTLAVGEGGGELVKQLLCQRYSMSYPKVIGVYLDSKPQPWVGPMDIALALIGAVFENGFAKNAVLEFTGPGIAGLSAEYRNGIDVMTTETACWSSIWQTDKTIQDYLTLHKRSDDYRELKPEPLACYDGMIKIDLSKIKPMIALPFHPSNVYELDELLDKPSDIFNKLEKDSAQTFDKPLKLGLLDKVDQKGRIHVEQGIIAGCAGGTFDNIMTAADILGAVKEKTTQDTSDFELSIYPGSQSAYLELARNGTLARLIERGAVVKTAFCGPCFGAGDVPPNQGLSLRHTTRNFPNREGSKPNQGQISSVALMDARSIAATALKGGILCSAKDTPYFNNSSNIPLLNQYEYHYDDSPYLSKVYQGFGKAQETYELKYGPGIADWPPMQALGENLLLKVVSFITDPVTTTDELIPSGETSSYRSNPLALAEFTLSRKDPSYVGKAKAVRDKSDAVNAELDAVFAQIKKQDGIDKTAIQVASAIYAVKPGDGSAREQAASCQRVLGGGANFAQEYATKRYRSNLINWGMIPFIIKDPPFINGDYIFIPDVKALIKGAIESVNARVFRFDKEGQTAIQGLPAFNLAAPELDGIERELILQGSLINYNRRQMHNQKTEKHNG